MRILIDIGHPGHVHLFRNMSKELSANGHKILFTCRQKEFEIELLKFYRLDYICIGKHFQTKIGKVFGLFKFNVKLFFVALRFKPDIFLSHGSFYNAHVSFLLGKTNIALEDTGNSEQVRLYKPFTKIILTSDVFHKQYGSKQIKYKSYHELAYLHPNQFKPDGQIRDDLGLKADEKAILVRFISWNATHDVGQTGIINKVDLIRKLSIKHKVFISAESGLPKELEQYKLKLAPEKIHSVMSEMCLFIGEGATMASECAVLGVPAIYVNTMEAGSIADQEKYNLLFHFKEASGLYEKAEQILTKDNLLQEFQNYRNRMLLDKIDLTAFLVWFIENYPESAKIMKENPDYQDRFK